MHCQKRQSSCGFRVVLSHVCLAVITARPSTVAPFRQLRPSSPSGESFLVAAEDAAVAEQSAPFQPQLNFSTYSRAPPPAPPPAAVADKPEQPDDQKLLDAEAPPSSKGRRYAFTRQSVAAPCLARILPNGH